LIICEKVSWVPVVCLFIMDFFTDLLIYYFDLRPLNFKLALRGRAAKPWAFRRGQSESKSVSNNRRISEPSVRSGSYFLGLFTGRPTMVSILIWTNIIDKTGHSCSKQRFSLCHTWQTTPLQMSRIKNPKLCSYPPGWIVQSLESHCLLRLPSFSGGATSFLPTVLSPCPVPPRTPPTRSDSFVYRTTTL